MHALWHIQKYRKLNKIELLKKATVERYYSLIWESIINMIVAFPKANIIATGAIRSPGSAKRGLFGSICSPLEYYSQKKITSKSHFLPELLCWFTLIWSTNQLSASVFIHNSPSGPSNDMALVLLWLKWPAITFSKSRWSSYYLAWILVAYSLRWIIRIGITLFILRPN